MDNTEKILEWINSENSKQIELIEQEFKKKLDSMKIEFKRETEQKKAQIEREYAKKMEMEKARIISSANVAARRIIDELKEEVINKAFNNAKIELYGLAKTQSTNYRKFLKKIISESVRKLSIKNVILLVRADDRDVILKDRLLSEIELQGISVKFEVDDTINGGAIVMSVDRKLRIDATIDTIFEQNIEQLRYKISAILFK